MPIFYVLTVFILLASCQAPTTPCKIAFRMDDIQTDFIEEVQKAVINVFITQSVPVTLGVITGVALDVGVTGSVMELIKNNLGSGKIELASHSVDHVGFTTLTLAQQIKELTDSANTIRAAWPANPYPVKTFITPFNLYNNNTLNAMRSVAGYNTISAQFSRATNIDDPFFYTDCTSTGLHDGIYHYPELPETSLNGNPPLLPASQVLAAVKSQLDSCNAVDRVSVIMLHFVEYANNNADNVVNQTALNVLIDIVQTVKTYPCELRLLQDLSRPFASAPTVLSIAPSTPTTSQTPLTGQPTLSTTDLNSQVAAALRNPPDFNNPFFTCNNISFDLQPSSTNEGKISFKVTCPSTCDQSTVCNQIISTLYTKLASVLTPAPCRLGCLRCSLTSKKRDELATSTAVVTVAPGYNSSSGIFASLTLLLIALFIAM